MDTVTYGIQMGMVIINDSRKILMGNGIRKNEVLITFGSGSQNKNKINPYSRSNADPHLIRVAEPEPEPAFFDPFGAGAVIFPWLRLRAKVLNRSSV